MRKNTWLSFQARVDAIWHKIWHPTHRVKWRTNEANICPGDIACETCNQVFWCRMLGKKEK